eukprot:630870-Rhodomonas_salina.1
MKFASQHTPNRPRKEILAATRVPVGYPGTRVHVASLPGYKSITISISIGITLSTRVLGIPTQPAIPSRANVRK